MGSPDGGWYDEDPPQVVGASPADRGTNVKAKKVRISFDEFIKIENATENVVVSPPQIEMPEIKATGKRIEVELKDSLKPNTTYTIDFSDAITDNNEGNPLGNYTYSFSTGAEIDTMEVSGYVLEAENLEPVKGIMVGLYESGLPDSVFTTEPLVRVARTDSRGHFVIKGIAAGGCYRVYALQDADGDYHFTQKSEKIAFNHDVVVPSAKPDTRQDTLWRDSVHLERITVVPYTHFFPDDIMLRAFTEVQTDRVLIKNERKDPDHITFYFSYGHDELPTVRGLNFDDTDAFIVDATEKKDTVTFWLRDTTLVNQDTLTVETKYLMTDTLGQLVEKVDTFTMMPKESYAKRQKQKQKFFEEWQKKQEKLKKRGEPYDSIMPVEPIVLKINAPQQLDPDKNILFDSKYPLQKADTSMIHLYTKRDTVWYQARYELRKLSELKYMLYGEWRPEQEYSLEIDSMAFCDIYGFVNHPQKMGFKVKGNDAYSTLLFTLTGMKDQTVVAQLLNANDAVVKEATSDNGNVEFFYVNPGTYYLRIFVDRNKNGLWDTGNYALDEQPEDVYYYHEEIECKAKWDVTLNWDPKERLLNLQKPDKLVKQKGDKKKTIKRRNAERAEKLGIKYEPKKKSED
ncbi:MAG: Ig-like domain-containing protein [Prevotella sp.]|nr:Ig-like domain-containing protein [Prevotella sp.]